MDIRLQNITADDIPLMVALQKQSFARLYAIYRDEGSPFLRDEAEWQRWLERSDVDIYQIYAEGELCGGISVYRRARNECYLARLFVLPELQCRGVGSSALRLCEEHYPEAAHWSLDFPIEQAANRRCYEKAGYIDTGRRDVKSETLTLAVYEKKIDGIYPVCETELAACAAVIRESFATVAKQFHLTPENSPRHTSFLKEEQLQAEWRGGDLPFGYYRRGVLCGYAALRRQGKRTYELKHLAVLPHLRQQGIGEQLLELCKMQLKTRKGKTLAISIIEENESLKGWYAQRGFTHTGTKTFPQLPFTAGYMEWKVKRHC